MRKINPSDICNDFRSVIASLEAFLSDSMGTAISPKSKSLLAELVFHRGYVAVESFISAWMVGAINRNQNQFFKHRSARVSQSVADKFTDWDVIHLNYSPPVHVSVADLKSLADPDGWNITFKAYAKFESRSKEWLDQAFASKVSAVPTQRKAIIDAAKAIRNCIAHRSKSSFDEMNTLLGSLPNSGVAKNLRTTVNTVTNIGSHLKAGIDGKMRLQHYLDEFKQLGGDLV